MSNSPIILALQPKLLQSVVSLVHRLRAAVTYMFFPRLVPLQPNLLLGLDLRLNYACHTLALVVPIWRDAYKAGAISHAATLLELRLRAHTCTR